ncbi:MAG TPA: MarR family transcriptional regulator, partial [Actinomycetota bacterium]
MGPSADVEPDLDPLDLTRPRPPWDPPLRGEGSPGHLIRTIRTVHRLLCTRFEDELFEMGVSYAQFEVMELLEAEPKLHGGEIARRLRISRQAAHHLLRKLQHGGLAELLPRDEGLRGARLTDDGRERIAFCRTALTETRRKLADVDLGTRQRLVTDLETVERAL